jgi:hypothetical protein
MKITPDHLARGAFIYNPLSTSLPTIMRADGVNMALPHSRPVDDAIAAPGSGRLRKMA